MKKITLNAKQQGGDYVISKQEINKALSLIETEIAKIKKEAQAEAAQKSMVVIEKSISGLIDRLDKMIAAKEEQEIEKSGPESLWSGLIL